MDIIMRIQLLKYSNHYKRRMAALKVLPDACKQYREDCQVKREIAIVQRKLDARSDRIFQLAMIRKAD